MTLFFINMLSLNVCKKTSWSQKFDPFYMDYRFWTKRISLLSSWYSNETFVKDSSIIDYYEEWLGFVRNMSELFIRCTRFIFFRYIKQIYVLSRAFYYLFFLLLEETSPKLIIPDFTFIISYILLNWLIAKITHAILMQAR